ncbi:hypothetical protein D1224_14760 [Henriciella barbarensis]|uniref:PhiE125 gp8 family phage protein n=1 Tax=Henriciella barbarensis TaxID=86342 RepID=A0A399QQ14_9PROT|nr:hypothetical protein [Henriciella barbarensis]RIJ20384.1 hypothetical protein D1224_14760 [Henriciella barbarensis]
MTLTVLTPPDEEPVSLSTAKSYLRIGHDGEDELVAALIAGARAALETQAGLCLVRRTLRWSLSVWPRDLVERLRIRLPAGPVSGLVSVRSIAGEVVTGLTSRFVLDGQRLCLRTGSWLSAIETGARVEVDFTAGFGGAEDVPEDLSLALLAMVDAAYSRGGVNGGLPETAETLIAARREVRL